MVQVGRVPYKNDRRLLQIHCHIEDLPEEPSTDRERLGFQSVPEDITEAMLLFHNLGIIPARFLNRQLLW